VAARLLEVDATATVIGVDLSGPALSRIGPVAKLPLLDSTEDLVELPDGRTTIYGVVTCGECVGVLPFLDPGTVLMIKQYRYVAKRVTWEMPTGGVHPGETLDAAANREPHRLVAGARAAGVSSSSWNTHSPELMSLASA
jgi:hypothetical protein